MRRQRRRVHRSGRLLRVALALVVFLSGLTAISSALVVASSGAAEAADGSDLAWSAPTLCGSGDGLSGGPGVRPPGGYGQIWVRAGETLSFQLSGEILDRSLNEYIPELIGTVDGVQVFEKWAYIGADDWNPTNVWKPFGPITLSSWTNSTGADVLVGLNTYVMTGVYPAGVRWTYSFQRSGAAVDCAPVEAAERFGANPGLKNQCPGDGQAADPVDTWSGNLSMPLPGLSVRGRGPGLVFGLTYNSLGTSLDEGFGPGWSSTLGMSLATQTDGTVLVAQESGSTIRFWPDGSGGWSAPRRYHAQLTQDGSGGWSLLRCADEAITFGFDSSGHLVSITDRNGHAVTLHYGSGASVDEIQYAEDASGRKLHFTWAAGHVDSIEDELAAPDGPRSLSFSYDVHGDLVQYTDTGGGVWAMGYDAHRLTTLKKPRHNGTSLVVESHYDGSGRVDWQENELGERTSFHYDDPVAGATRVVFPDPDGAGPASASERVDYYDALGLRTQVTSGYGSAVASTTTFVYDPVTLGVLSKTDNAGHVWRYGYDANGNRIQAQDPLGRVTSATYDAWDEPLTRTDGLGHVSSWTYDGAGNVLTTTTPVSSGVGATTSLAYGMGAMAGEVVSVTDPLGHVTTLGYDGAGDRTSVTDALGDVVSATYDAVGRVLTTTSATGGVTTYAYDGAGRVTSVSDPLGRVTGYGYDADGNLTSTVDASGVVTTTVFDAVGRPTSVTRADGTTAAVTTVTAYDADGRVVSRTDGNGQVTGYAYDALGRVVSSTDPLSRVTVYGYDLVGNLVTTTDPSGGVTTRTWDADGELTGVSYSDGVTPGVTYGYDGAGRRTSMHDGTGTSSDVYDWAGELVSHTDGAGATTGYGYDLGGRQTSVTYPNGQTVTRGFDAAGRESSLTDWLGHSFGFGYDDADRPTTTIYPNGVTATTGYDAAGQVAAITDTLTPSGGGSTSTLAAFSYAHDTRGDLTSAATTGTAWGAGGGDPIGDTWTYDPLDRLTGQVHTPTSASGATVTTSPYAYDAAGNPTTLTALTTTSTTGSAGVAGSVAQVFDAAGQLTSSTTTPAAPASPPGLPSGGASPVLDVEVSADTSTTSVQGSVSSPSFSTTTAGELVVVLVSAVQDSAAGYQTNPIGVAGAGLSWHLVSRSDGSAGTVDAASGTVEVWQAWAPTVLSGAVVTASFSPDAAGQVTVAAFTGAAPSLGSTDTGLGATDVASQFEGNPQVTVTPTTSGSLIWGVGVDTGNWFDYTTPAGQRREHLVGSWDTVSTAWVQSASAATGTTVTAGSPVTLSVSGGPTWKHHWAMAGVEIRPAGTAPAAGVLAMDRLVHGVETVDADADAVAVSGLSTTTGAELLVATVTAGEYAWWQDTGTDPANQVVTGLTSTGGGTGAAGLVWTLQARSHVGPGTGNGSLLGVPGDVEVWTARPLGVVTNLTVTASLAQHRGADITVVAFYGAGGLGATAVGHGAFDYNTGHVIGSGAAPSVPVTTTAAGAQVWAAGTDTMRVSDHWPASGQVTVTAQADQTVWETSDSFYTGWTQQATTPIATAGTTVTMGVVDPDLEIWNMVAYEIIPTSGSGGSGGDPGEGGGSGSGGGGPPVTTTYTYDTRGDRVAAATETPGETGGTPTTTTVSYAYDQDSHLTGVTGLSAGAVSYGYDGDGLRTAKTIDDGTAATTTHQSWDVTGAGGASGGLPLLIGDGTVFYVYGPDGRVVEQIDGSTSTYYLADQQGSTRVLTDQTGAVVATYDYDAWGTTTGHTGTVSTPLLFDGQYQDAETGYYYLRARFYDPATAVFLTIDPLEASTGEPYVYAANNPVNLTDPSGQCPTCLWGALLAAGTDLGLQAAANLARGCGAFHHINWGSVATSALIGGLTMGASTSLMGVTRAAKPAIGFADDAVGSAYQGMRSGGGHAIRHLRDKGLISNSGSLASQVSQFERLTSPILRSPSSTFDWRLGNTLTRGFAGEAGGQQVVVFVAKEGPYQGRVLSAVVPDANQMAQWGLP